MKAEPKTIEMAPENPSPAGPIPFADPWNPSSSEVRAWAYAHNAQEPCQDWDLALAWAGHERDYLEFSADTNCPSRLYFLHVVYLMVGDAVRNDYRTTPKAVVQGFVEQAANTRCKSLQRWRERSLRLLAHPSEFDYTAWCGGGYSRAEI